MSPYGLPALFVTNGEWEVVLVGLYHVFHNDFIVGRPRFQTLPVWWNRTVKAGEQYEEGFWHLITKGDPADRLFDPRRAERLPWCGPSIASCHEPCYLVWDYREGSGVIRTYIWYQAGNYIVVLEKRQHRAGVIAFLVTAHYVEGAGRRRNLQAKYDKREP